MIRLLAAARAAAVAALALLLPAAGLAGPRDAQAAAPAVATVACRDCHKDVGLEGSVHKGVSCLACHAGLESRPGTPPHQAAKEVPEPSCTLACHKQAPPPGETGPAAYADSVHGKAYLERREPGVARCWDCHGKHNAIRATADPASLVNRRNIPLTCSRCHDDMSVVVRYNIHVESTYLEYRRSVHGRALFDKGLVSFAAVCTDCHGVHDIQPAGLPAPHARDPRTCGRCHALVLEQFADSVHGPEALKGNRDAPSCVDCHGEHGIAAPRETGSAVSKARLPDTCSACHARPEIMRKYGVPEDRIKTFIESWHGIAIGMGDKAEASCSDCHGVHDIHPAADPRSSVNPARLAATCGRPACHPGMPARIAGAKIHRDVGARSSGAPYYVRKILIWLLVLAAAVTAIWFVPALFRRASRL